MPKGIDKHWPFEIVVGRKGDDVVMEFTGIVPPIGMPIETARRVAEMLFKVIGDIEGTSYMNVKMGPPKAMKRDMDGK